MKPRRILIFYDFIDGAFAERQQTMDLFTFIIIVNHRVHVF